MSLKKETSPGKAVEVTMKRKEENSSDFVWISSKNSASVEVTVNSKEENS